MPMRVPALRVRQRQPAHEPRQLPVILRPNHQMPVIGHQTPIQYPHPRPLLRLPHDPLESRVIRIIFKHRHPPVGPVDDVIDISARIDSFGSSHAFMILEPPYPVKLRFLTPF